MSVIAWTAAVVLAAAALGLAIEAEGRRLARPQDPAWALLLVAALVPLAVAAAIVWSLGRYGGCS